MTITCAKTFGSWLKSNPAHSIIYKSLGSPRPFDVSLRDGLQSSKLEQMLETSYKFDMFVKASTFYEPEAVEIGSLVSPKVLPMLADSTMLYKMAIQVSSMPLYLLVPSSSKLDQVMDLGCSHISLITSVSEKFQLTNTKKTLSETKADIKKICKNFPGKTKLYLSCIDTCPLAGPIDHNFICDQIEWYWKECGVNTLCLSDTVGQLKPKSFVSIVDQAHAKGVPYSLMSLHLHVSSQQEVIEIMGQALARGITGFDVSYLETGGCSVTMGKSKTKPNLSYPLYYEGLKRYIESISSNSILN